MTPYPFLISVPHGGIEVPSLIKDKFTLSPRELEFYSDPATMRLYCFKERVECYCDTPVSRMAVDLNRPPYHLPPRYPDGVIKQRTVFGTSVYADGSFPEMPVIHQMLMAHYFPYHAEIDRMLETGRIALGLDCHSMLPFGPPGHRDAGSPRPFICIGNNGDADGGPKPGGITTAPASWMIQLADSLKGEFSWDEGVAINHPFSGGFISNAHFWHKGIPWIQLEVNRALYDEDEAYAVPGGRNEARLHDLSGMIWNALTRFWDELS